VVPSSAASCALLPICTWRTMFSRTTMASSISRPTHRLSAISVTMLIVKPNRYMNRKVPISAIGSVSPVMTVERQLLRNRNTMPMVSTAPSTACADVGHRDADGARVVAHHLSATPGGSSALRCSASPQQAVDHGDGVLALALLHVSSTMRWPLYSARRLLLLRAVDHVGHLPQLDRLAAAARHDHDVAEVVGALQARVDLHHALAFSASAALPAGSSWFSLRSADITWSTPTPSASIAAGFR
jgi:hypothetical protein